ncbi:MAG TPA: hypothetical protein VGM67_15970 [Gemmatimonadaceae bacterium]|jgi:hypothetical protein
MQNDDDLRERFHALAAEESSKAPEFSLADIESDRASLDAHRHHGASPWRRRVAFAGAFAASALIALTIGLVWGTNTGYASARVANERQRDELAMATTAVKSQLSALRIDLARVRSDLARKARNGNDSTRASLVSAELELRSMEASAERIDIDLAQRRAGATPPALQLTGLPVKRALAITCSAFGQPTPPQQPASIPVVDLPKATTRTSETFGGILGLRQTSDGNVLVNDAARRQIKLLDSSFATATVVMDSVTGTSTSYGSVPTTLIPYLGDSSLFADRLTQTMLVLNGRGHITRSLALPKRTDFLAVTGGPSGVDANGNVIYRALRRGGIKFPGTHQEDSLLILRADLDFRRVDTIGRIARPLMLATTQPTSYGGVASVWAPDPLQPVDEWDVLSNGAVAFVRGHDYHVDWIEPSGATLSTPKLPFDWTHFTDEDKQRLTDSVRAGQNALLAGGYPDAELAMITPCPPADATAPPASGVRTGAGGSSAAPPPRDPDDRSHCSKRFRTNYLLPGGIAASAIPPLPSLADLVRVGPVEDYEAPIGINSTLADRDGNLWILPRKSPLSRSGELVYDVVNAQGKLFERVRLPVGRAIAGFGKGGVVYLTAGDHTTGYHLERTKLAPGSSAPPTK